MVNFPTSEPRCDGAPEEKRNKSAINKLSSDNMKLYILRLAAYDSRPLSFLMLHVVLEKGTSGGAY